MEENKRKNKRKAKKQAKKNKIFEKMRKHVQTKYNKKIEEKEKKLGRELTRVEKNKILNDIINGVGTQLVATSATFVSNISTNNGVMLQPALPAPKEENTIDEEAKNKEFEAKEKIIKEKEAKIDEIKSKEDIKKWLKDVYIEKYKELTGKEDLCASDIDIKNKKILAMYKTEEGQYIATIKSLEKTQKMLDEKGIAYIENIVKDVYTVTTLKDKKIIDCTNKDVDGYHNVIVAEYYIEMQKDKNPVLVELGDLIPNVFELYSYYNQLEEKPGNEFIESVIEESKKNLKEKYFAVFEIK